MTPSPSAEVTRLLRAWGQVDDQALEKLTPMVYQELRRLARHYMRGERDGHTLQTTALVNEAYLRLVDATGVEWQDRAHFFAVSAQMMRRILVDAARGDTARQPGRCPGRRLQKSECELVALDDALAALAEFDPHKAKVSGVAVLRGTECRRDGRGVKNLSAKRDARLEASQGMADARIESRELDERRLAHFTGGEIRTVGMMED